MSTPSIRLFLYEKKYSLFLLLGGIIGLLASFILTLDKIKLLENPRFTPACSLNPIITCTAAMSSAQATTFGIPNSMGGIVLFTALIIVGGSIAIGVQYSKRVLGLVAYAAAAGFLFTNYLILQSVLVLHVVCPWCFTIWLSAPMILLGAIMLYAQKSNDTASKKLNRMASKTLRHSHQLILLWYVVLFILLAVAFRDFFTTLL
jgi:uncharacterized membrane protein